jgi:hypothetical protein
MEYLNQFLSSLIADPDTTRWVMTALIASAIFIAGLALMLLVAGVFNPIRQRLYDVVGDKSAPTLSSKRISQALQPLSPYILPKQERERSKSRERLLYAGYRSPTHLMF